MVRSLLGRKVGMTQVYDSEGLIQRVTVLKVGPCRVVGHHCISEKENRQNVRIGFEAVKASRLNKPLAGVYKKSGKETFRILREVEGGSELPKIGTDLDVGLFEKQASVDVTGLSKGRGFQGVMKRWNFAGGPAAHGSMFHRIPGAIGQCAYPGEVFKGQKMPGRMGHRKVTTLNLKVVRVDKEKGLMLVRGSVPGHRGSLVMVRGSVKRARGGKK